MKNQLAYIIVGIGVLIACAPVKTWAHAFPDHSSPRVGAMLFSPPESVRIWFDGYLEPSFSTIEVYDKNEVRVDKQDGAVNALDPTLLEVWLPTLSFGVYRVVWTAVAIDGHRTEGDFTFTIGAAGWSPLQTP